MISTLKTIVLYLCKVSVFNTLKANFRLLPKRQAFKLPILIFKNTTLKIGADANFVLDCPLKTGLVKFGCTDIYHIPKRTHTYLSFDGLILVKGCVSVSYNSRIIVGRRAQLILGGENYINHDSSVLALERIELCHGCSIGWEVHICDSAFHYVVIDGNVKRKTSPIRLGRQTWVCSYCNICRGAVLPDYSILSNCSMLNKDFSPEGNNLLIAGIPAKIIKKGVSRIMEFIPENDILCEKLDQYFVNHPTEDSIAISSLIHKDENR